jgi:CheY-like chemotaxis protein
MQVDASTSRAHGGLGLGLSIVRHLVEAHGGTVQAHSEGLGLGAAFTVSLPIRAVNKVSAEAESDARVEAEVKASPGVKAEADDTATHASLRGVRILVVDDDRDSLSVLREVLGSAGAEVTTASSAGEAFEVIERGDAFELIVSDIGMPGMDGYAFIRQVRSRAAGGDTPAIALTAYARPSDAELAKRAGFQEHLTKPVDERELLRAARTLSQA